MVGFLKYKFYLVLKWPSLASTQFSLIVLSQCVYYDIYDCYQHNNLGRQAAACHLLLRLQHASELSRVSLDPDLGLVNILQTRVNRDSLPRNRADGIWIVANDVTDSNLKIWKWNFSKLFSSYSCHWEYIICHVHCLWNFSGHNTHLCSIGRLYLSRSINALSGLHILML